MVCVHALCAHLCKKYPIGTGTPIRISARVFFSQTRLFTRINEPYGTMTILCALVFLYFRKYNVHNIQKNNNFVYHFVQPTERDIREMIGTNTLTYPFVVSIAKQKKKQKQKNK